MILGPGFRILFCGSIKIVDVISILRDIHISYIIHTYVDPLCQVFESILEPPHGCCSPCKTLRF